MNARSARELKAPLTAMVGQTLLNGSALITRENYAHDWTTCDAQRPTRLELVLDHMHLLWCPVSRV